MEFIFFFSFVMGGEIHSSHCDKVIHMAGTATMPSARGLDLPFPRVFVPGNESKCHIRAFEDVQVAPCRLVAYSQGARQFAAVPGLAVIVRQHGPETAQSEGRKANTQLRQIAFQIGADEGFAPIPAQSRRIP